MLVVVVDIGASVSRQKQVDQILFKPQSHALVPTSVRANRFSYLRAVVVGAKQAAFSLVHVSVNVVHSPRKNNSVHQPDDPRLGSCGETWKHMS
jgi:hypothetical protein